MYDLHLHSDLSYDSKENLENYIKAARKKGNVCIGFAEHYDLDRSLDPHEKETPALADLKKYSETVSLLRETHADVKILKGLELGWSRAALPYYRKIIDENDFDYAILSVHAADGRGDCYFPAYFEGRDRKEAYSEYLGLVAESVTSDLDYQIVGHLGYVARYAPYGNKRLVYNEFPYLFDIILKEIIERGKCLELNTSCTGETFVTDVSILKRYIELGGRYFSFGSDAHSEEKLGYGYDEAVCFLKENGINFICGFEKKKIIEEKI